MECPWYKDGMCVFDVEKSECIEEFTCMKCNANPDNIEYTPMEMEQPDFYRQTHSNDIVQSENIAKQEMEDKL